MKPLFNQLKISVLAWLLHHANRVCKDEYFYTIKNMILSKYGQHVCYDVQFIEGKKCHSCGGTGIYKSYGWHGVREDYCYHCYNGWYKRPVWNILAKVRFGKYEFYQPFQRIYEKPETTSKIIEGYIDHTPSRYSHIAATILFLIYEKGYLKRFYKSNGNGWRSYWWQPRNWIYNLFHIIKHGRRSIPFQKYHKGVIRIKLERLFNGRPKPVVYCPDLNEEDLPF